MLTGRRATGAVAVVGVFAAILTGCSGGDDAEPDPAPKSADMEVPEGVTLTSGGSTMNVGQSASVIYQPEGAERTVITVRVDDIERGEPHDLAGVDDVDADAVPFYVEASIHNAGPSGLTGAPVPLYAVDGSSHDIDATELPHPVTGCDPLPSESTIKRGATAQGCLLFAVPRGATFRGVQLSTSDLGSPVTWKP